MAGDSHANGAQDAACLLQHEDTLLVDGQFVVHHDSQGLSSKDVFQLASPKLFAHGVISSHMQDSAPDCV